MAALTRGIELDDGPARFDVIRSGGGGQTNNWYSVGLHEGRNREVRRLFEAVGLTVSRLIRTRYGPVALGRMARGRYRFLDGSEIGALRAAVGLTEKQQAT